MLRARQRTRTKKDIFLSRRQAALTEGHKRSVASFHGALAKHLDDGLLTKEQAAIVMEYVVRLAERDRNPTNTGNLQDLFSATLLDTQDPLRAFAQVVADSVKVVPMPEDAQLLPPIRDGRKGKETFGKTFREVKQLPLGAPQKMLVAHTNVAYTDPEASEAVRRMIKACEPTLDEETTERRFYQLVVQSQHMPSSSFVLAAASGLVFEVEVLYRKAGYSEEQIEAARGFYETAAQFDPKWLSMFMGSGPRNDEGYLRWLEAYHSHRANLPPELKYQLESDTRTNFHLGTLTSGKWVDAAVQFGNVKKVQEIPAAIARIVNQYLAEFEDLHREPRSYFLASVRPTLEEFGVSYSPKKGAFVASSKPPAQRELIARQFADAWHRKIVAGVLRSSPLFERVDEGLRIQLLDNFERVVFGKDEVILKTGRPGAGLFVVVDGAVMVDFPNHDGHMAPVELGIGDVFGEIELLSGGRNTARITSTTETVALVIRPKRFQQIIKCYTGVEAYLKKLAGARIKEIEDETRRRSTRRPS